MPFIIEANMDVDTQQKIKAWLASDMQVAELCPHLFAKTALRCVWLHESFIHQHCIASLDYTVGRVLREKFQQYRLVAIQKPKTVRCRACTLDKTNHEFNQQLHHHQWQPKEHLVSRPSQHPLLCLDVSLTPQPNARQAVHLTSHLVDIDQLHRSACHISRDRLQDAKVVR